MNYMLNSKIIALIPARGGSKGIPRKNLIPLNGKPLIAYSIEQAISVSIIDRIFVSTDDEEIKNTAIKYNAEIIPRPDSLAQDDSSMLQVLKHAVDYVENTLKFNFDILVLLQPTSPLRKPEFIERAIRELMKNNCESVTTAYKIEHNINTLIKINNGKTEYFIRKPIKDIRQKTEEIYRIDGAVVVFKKSTIQKQQDYMISDINNRAIIIPEKYAIEIDTLHDLKVAEFIMKDEQKD